MAEIAIDEFMRSGDGESIVDVAMSEEPEAARFLVAVLHGRHGEEKAKIAVESLLGGVGYGGDFDYFQPMADFWLMEGRLEMFDAVVRSGVPRAFETSLSSEGVVPALMQWLNALSRVTRVGRDNEREMDFLEVAKWRSGLEGSRAAGEWALKLVAGLRCS